MYITGRMRKLGKLLIQAEQEKTVMELANTLDVSERTIHRDLKNLEEVLFDQHLELVKKAGIGVQIMGSIEDKRALERTLSRETATDYTPEERQAIVLATLLRAIEPVKLYSLATELYVTIATISHDLDQLEKEVTNFQLHIIRKRGYGVTIDGREANKRAALSHLISRHVDTFMLISILKENVERQGNSKSTIISRRLLEMVNPDILRIIEKRVQKVQNELPYELADSAYIGLVVHLALAIERLKKGETIQFDPTYLKQLEMSKEYDIANRMIEDIAVSLDMSIPKDEVGYITMHLRGAKLRVNEYQFFDDPNLDIAYQIKLLIQYVGEKLEIDLTENTSLLNDLAAHLNPTIYRLQQGMNIHNPLIDEIQHNYAELFQIVREAVEIIFVKWKFPDEEIGFLVLHFGAALIYHDKKPTLRALVICSSGIGTAKILATNLTKQFPEVHQVDNISLFDLDEMDIDAYDLIVSTIPLEGFTHDYILTSPFLRETEIHRIKKRIRGIILAPREKMEKKSSKYGHIQIETDFMDRLELMKLYATPILNIMRSFQVRQIREEQSMETALQSICKDLERQQVIRDSHQIVQKLLEREKVGGLGIPSTSMTLFHTRSEVVTQPCFTIYSLDFPISVKGMDGQIIKVDTLLVMLAPADAPQETLEVFSFVSSLLIKGERNTAVFESGNEQRIKNLLLEQMELFMKDKKLI